MQQLEADACNNKADNQCENPETDTLMNGSDQAKTDAYQKEVLQNHQDQNSDINDVI